MSLPITESPPAEQQVCIHCGLCCDGTLFRHAVLQAGEKGQLPEKIEARYARTPEKEMFMLPCCYFEGKCSIYNQKKAFICSAFRCQLLNEMAAGQLTQAAALEAVATAHRLRADIFSLYENIYGQAYPKSFYELIFDLPELYTRAQAEPAATGKRVDQLVMKCGLLDTLLIKTFKSRKNFQGLFKDSMF